MWAIHTQWGNQARPITSVYPTRNMGASGSFVLRSEVAKPPDASDITTLEEARVEVARLRRLAADQLVAVNPWMDPEEALRAFAESVGKPVDAMRERVTRGDGGEIVEIDWRYEDLEGTLPVGDMHMPYLRYLDLWGNREMKGEAKGVGVTVVKSADCSL